MLIIGLAPLARDPECVTVAYQPRARSFDRRQFGTEPSEEANRPVVDGVVVDQPGGEP